MPEIEDELALRIATLEKELKTAWEEMKGFEEKVLAQHRSLKWNLVSYLLDSRILAFVTAPIIYAGVVPFAMLDLFLWLYQTACFPVYGIPKVKRSLYIVFDRGHLRYLNSLERVNCVYCSYANGLFAYAVEVGARTEQHWCPIKHSRRLRAPHSRYGHFIPFGDAEQYRSKIETVRSDFVDIKELPK